jgi:methylphosphotriester-DNA--protein-cysteine methyltransferase
VLLYCKAVARYRVFTSRHQPAAEERGFRALKQIYDEAHEDRRKTLVEFKGAVREQTFLVRLDEEHALETLTVLLKDNEHRLATMHAVRRMEKAMGPGDAEREARIRQVEELLGVLEPAALPPSDWAAVPTP